jgi:malonate transporter
MELGNLVGVLIPVFFVLVLGYLAGRAHSFEPDQVAGLSKLALGFALPASLFAGMSGLPRDLLLGQAKLAVALLLVHVGLLFLTHVVLHSLFKVQATRSLIFSLMIATSATPIFGVAVLSPLLGKTAVGAVGLVAVAINFAVPAAVILLEVDAATKLSAKGSQSLQGNPVLSGLKSGLRSPLLWAPILGCAVALLGKQLPTIAVSSLNFIGSATSGVAVFAVGLSLAAHPVTITRAVVLGSLARVTLQTACLFLLARMLHISGPIYRETLICCSFPPATTAPLLAAKYGSSEAESASVLLITTVLLVVTIPVLIFLSR